MGLLVRPAEGRAVTPVGLMDGSLVGANVGNGVDGIGFNIRSAGSDTTASVTLLPVSSST